MGDCGLLPELPKDLGREGDVGDDQGSRRHDVGRSLLFQNTVELTHAAPFFGAGEPRLVGDDTTIGSDQDVLHIGRPDDLEQKVSETDGAPSLGLELRVVDRDRNRLPAGQQGRLQTRGTSTFVGYLKRPELYNVDGEGWFDTGDLARLDADGYVTITGRWKDVIIRGGENIPVVEIENVLYRHPAVRQVAIVAMPDARLGERACAFVVVREATSLAFGDMQEFLLKSGVARSYWPERLELVGALPTTATGKIQKFVLRERARELVEAQEIYSKAEGIR
jgi:cyclohexanecarboxylate-CoA ligase